MGRTTGSGGGDVANEPSYQVVVNDLRRQVAAGAFGPSGKLPAESELATTYGVSRHTVRRAFQELVGDGLVERTRGRGTFVRPSGSLFVRQMGSVDDLMALSRDTTMEVLEPLTLVMDVVASSRLRLEDHLVGRLRLVRAHEGVRFCQTEVHLPPAIARALLDTTGLADSGGTSGATVIGLIEQHLAVRIAEAQQEITVETADATTSTDLGRPPGHPVLRIDRLYLDEDERPVELAVSRFLPEHYSYRTRLRRTR